MEQVQKVSVAVRIRPVLRDGRSAMHQQERYELIACQRMGDHGIQLQEQRVEEACRSSTFTFDHIFDQDSTQTEVYEEAVLDLIDGALQGVNATILAYGQTGSGKTHTVLGDVKPNPLENDLLTANSGLFLRVLSDLIEYREKRKKEMHVVIGLSCVEIYNENIRDLFGGTPSEPPPPLKVVMTDEIVYMPSLIVKEVTTMNSVFNEIQLAVKRRQSRQTDSNAASSRSHCLFTIDLMQRKATADPPKVEWINQPPNSSMNPATGGGGSSRTGSGSAGAANQNRQRSVSPSVVASSSGRSSTPSQETGFIGQVIRMGDEEPIYFSKVVLADLAGSEKTKSSHVTGEGLAEATSINSSLTALGNVVHSLHEGSYVSYRVSNLTRLLKPAFCQPTARVLLLAQLSPTQLTYDESISTLHFANKVKAMKVVTNQGAEGDTLGFCFMETEKIADPLRADYRIFMAESGCGPVCRRGRIQKQIGGGGNIWSNGSCYVHGEYKKPASPGLKKDRLPSLQADGVASLAERDQQLQKAKEEERKQREEREKPKRVQELRDLLLNEYHSVRKELEEQWVAESARMVNDGKQHLIIESSFEVQKIKLAEEQAWDLLTNGFDPQRLEILKAQFAKGEIERKRLAAIRIQRPTDDGAEAQRALDTYYATSVFCHGNARRCYEGLMEVRETQIAAYRARLMNNKVAKWAQAEEEKRAKTAAPAPASTAAGGTGAQRPPAATPSPPPAAAAVGTGTPTLLKTPTGTRHQDPSFPR
jgi:hypothetical protein